MVGIMVSTAALVVVLSVFNGMSDIIGGWFNALHADYEVTLREGKSFAVDSFPIHEQGWGRGLVPHLQIQLMLAFRHDKGLGHAKLQFAVESQIKLTLGGNTDRLFPFKGESFAEFYRDVVGVLLPEGRKHRSPLRTTVIEDVAQPYFEVARIPYPCCLCCLHAYTLL